MFSKRIRPQLFAATVILLFGAAVPADAQPSMGTLGISFEHVVDGRILNMDTAVYKNELGQTYTISNFKYYISGITLKNESGKEFSTDDHFLINEEEAASKKITLNKIPQGNYTGIRFMIGVDSIHNCSGAQSGALDPVNAMFWAWNTGYIFLKLEGKAATSTATGKTIEYHIGGYKAPANCIRSVDLNFVQTLVVNDGKTSQVQIIVNIAEVLRGPEVIDFSTLPAVTDFHNATKIADNYMDMFSVKEISNAH